MTLQLYMPPEPEALSEAERDAKELRATVNRDTAIQRIRAALKRRTGRTWSVKGGRGTAWGWISIDAPPARRTVHCQLKAGARTTWPEDYEEVDTSVPGGAMRMEDRRILAEALGLEDVHSQGVKIAANHDYYVEYIDRAEGRTPSVVGVPYWD